MIGRLELRALVPAVVASFVGDLVTRRLGIAHTPYPHLAHVPVTLGLLGELALMGIAMASPPWRSWSSRTT